VNTRRAALLAFFSVAACLLLATPAYAAPSPWWGISSTTRPGNLQPEGKGTIVADVTDLGDANATAPFTITDRLPAGVKAKSVTFHSSAFNKALNKKETGNEEGLPFTINLGPKGERFGFLKLCTLSTEEVSCTWPSTAELEAKGLSKAEAEKYFLPVRPYADLLEVRVSVELEEGVKSGALNEVALSGGGAAAASIRRPLTISEAQTPFGVEDFEFRPEEEGGALDTRAGSHPFQLTTYLAFKQTAIATPAALPKDLSFPLPAGFLGAVAGRPRCTAAQFAPTNASPHPECAPQTVVGATTALVNANPPGGEAGLVVNPSAVFNLTPAFGEPARFGFFAGGEPVILNTSLRSGPGEDYGVTVSVSNVAQLVAVDTDAVTFWGAPGDPRYDASRGEECLLGRPACIALAEANPTALLTLPAACPGTPFAASMSARSWEEPEAGPHPGAEYVLRDAFGNPLALGACNQVPFAPTIAAEPTSNAATSPTGLNFDLNVEDEGLLNPEGLAQSQIKKAVVALPQGFTANPSVAAGLGACSLAQYESTTIEAGSGCPANSKIGAVEVESPLVAGKIDGSLYVAKQGDNPFHNLLTLYMVFKNPELGVLVKSAGKVEPNPVTGQLTTTFDNIPQLPFSHFHLAFRSGQRSPLITPPACGPYTVKAKLYPWSNPTVPLEKESSFQITTGPEGQGCPSGGVPPFHPNLQAGTINNAAGTYSPFYVHMSRKDSEQEITHFSIKLPPGVIGKLAGVAECSDAAIAQAKAREHEGGGAEEEASPSCPAASQVGHSLVGSGVGNVLAYAPGKIYLAGPYHGSNLSMVSITAAKVGPFDLGTVVVRFALRINPETAEVFVDATGSDPIPHIVDGIPVHLRDIRAYVDRPEFTLNPTGCDPTSTASTVLGSGLDFASEADDQPVTVSSPFQAADCASLGFKPQLKLSLIGATHRGGTPKFKAVLNARAGDANIGAAQVTLPHSEFLDNAHIKTICTRVVFAQGTVPGEKCPADSVYGFAQAITPILSEPLEGPVYLRSSSHQLPDLVAALHNNQVNIALDGHVEGVNGGIRNTFEAVPDAPVTKFTLEMQGGGKGLLENSTNLCASPHHATAVFTGHNGKLDSFKPLLAVSCHKHGKKKGKRGGAHHRH
jgi:hypothetical protein